MIVILLIIATILLILYLYKYKEHFVDRVWYYPYTWPKYWRRYWPWYYYPTRRNMSYDLRGDVPVTWQYTGPWNLGTRVPINNSLLYHY